MVHPKRGGRWLRPPMCVALLLLAAAGLLRMGGAGAADPFPPGTPPVSGRSNHLSGESSPYLLQHAHNPIDWYPWGPEAFEKAKREGKPIFLSVGYSACHWCHVMERESFEDEGVAKVLNDYFVAVKVDREERPDVDELYMTAVQLLTGRGGWPMSVFLTPEGRPFHGGTYFPRTDFSELLREVREAWINPEKRVQIDAQAERLAKAIGAAAVRPPARGAASPALVPSAVAAYLTQLDTTNGGFGRAPKFPPPLRLALMLAEHRRTPDPRVLRAVTLTLDRMARGGLYDQVGGGFHRYSVDEKWAVPHFEKMLYDNALLSWIYLEASRVTGNSYYERIGAETLDFVLRELQDPDGGFWSTLDADSPGADGAKGEGQFYLWRPAETVAVLGKRDGDLFNRIYGISAAGNFEGR
ncbi:MAG TPA: thioredoxin domain-containing protein, partial [Armatimonadota bacterium]|nr:thioredoxin domain-containing protein [Armatimonadota bacterium]